jgi:hypothetical protein
MFTDILISLVFLLALAASLRQSDRRGLIARTPYNNRYSDAAAAREDHLG